MKKLIVIILYLLFSGTAYSATSTDISSASGGYTHTDPNTTLTETKHRIRWESHDCSDIAYQYKSTTVSGDFTHYVTFGFDASTGTSAMGVWCVTDTVSSMQTLGDNASAHALMLWLEDTGSACKLKLTERDGASLDESQEVTLAEGYRLRSLYLTIDRDSSDFTATVYRDPERTEQLHQISLTLNSVQTYTSIILAQSSGGESLTTYEEYTTGADADLTADSATQTAMTFTIQAGEGHDIDWCEIYAKRKGTGCSSVVAYIYAVDGSNHPTGAALATSTAENCTGWSTSSAWHKFVFPTPYTVSASTMYALRITSNGDVTNSLKWDVDNSSAAYAGGSGVHGNPWVTQTWDNLFKEGEGVTDYTGTADGFTSALYLDETPELFGIQTSIPLMYVQDSDGFNGFASSDETWTTATAGSATIAESSVWDSDGDGKSVLITGASGSDYANAYFAPASSTFGGGVLRLTFRLASLTTNQATEIGGLWDSGTSVGVIPYIQDVSGTKYFRLGFWQGGSFTASTATSVVCATGTDYEVVLTKSSYTNAAGLIIDGVLADSQGGLTDFTPDRIYVGYIGGGDSYRGVGVRYIDDLSYMNGTGYFPSVCRGGTGDTTLVSAFVRCDTHAITNDSVAYFQKSTDDGVTWTDFYNIPAAGGEFVYDILGIRWCAARSSWFFFVRYSDATPSYITKVFECTSLTVPTVNEIVDYFGDDGREIFVWPTQEIDGDGKLYVGIEDFDDADLKSGLFNWSDGVLSNENKFADGNDLGGYTIAAEPMLWHDSSDALHATIRFTTAPAQLNAVRYKVSTDDGDSDWSGNSLIDPGTDWYNRNAKMRAFVFQDSCWWIGRDNDPNTSPPGTWDTFIWKSDQDPDANNLIAVQEEVWFKSLGEGGNGDIDAKIVNNEQLYLDVGIDTFGTAWYFRMDTGEIVEVATGSAILMGW